MLNYQHGPDKYVSELLFLRGLKTKDKSYADGGCDEYICIGLLTLLPTEQVDYEKHI